MIGSLKRYFLRRFRCRPQGHVARIGVFDIDEDDREWLPLVFCGRCWDKLPWKPGGYIPLDKKPCVDLKWHPPTGDK